MKLKRLKELTYKAWECLSTFNSALVQPQYFKQEVRRIGDMRYKATWEKAYAQFTVKNILDCFEGCYSLITFHLNPSVGSAEEQELSGLVLDEFLSTAEGVDLVREGLEQIFGDSTYSNEKESAREFLGLVEQRREINGGGNYRLPVNARRLIGTTQN